MASSEKVISPGVFTNEIDQSFLPAAIGDIGAALIGPTVKGPANQPVVVSSYSEFIQKFGDSFMSGSQPFSYMTSLTAREYLKHGNALTVIRVLAGPVSTAKSIVVKGSPDQTSHTGSFHSHASHANTAPFLEASASFLLHTLSHGAEMNNNISPHGGADIVAQATTPVMLANNVLKSGSADNLRWEVTSQNAKKGTFTLNIRRGDDSNKRKNSLESYSNISLDPMQSNFIGKVIGDVSFTLKGSGTSSPYIQQSGSYPNRSKYVRVEIKNETPNYLNENGDLRDNNFSASLPGLDSGSFYGGSSGFAGFNSLGDEAGTAAHAGGYNFYENITDSNTQGFTLGTAASGKTAYEDAINLLGNQDEYDINLLLMPGVCDSFANGTDLVTKAIDMAENRGDCFVIIDPVPFDASLSTVTIEAETRDSSYAAVYWPWVQIADLGVNKNVWVPPSTVMGGVFAFNDKVSHPWFAPAGLNRGGIDSAVSAERKLTHGNRDTLYDSNVNPIATFPGQGVTVFGQKTLQKKSSALDRINVRRLLIKVKKFIASTSRFLLFEQNTSATRNRFLNIVNPYMEQIQANSGLSAFRVVMDESNNTPDLIDRNILYGQIFLQPTRTAEFIILDFTVQPTGASFPE